MRHEFMKSTLLTLILGCMPLLAQQQTDTVKKYIKVESGYLMVLRQGDDLFQELKKLAVVEQVPSANFTGMGFVNIRFGFFDFSKKDYKPKNFKNMELASMHGTIAWQDGQVSIHGHGVVAGKDFKAYAGHILDAQVSTGSVEILVTVHNPKLERKKDEQLGANILILEE